MSATLLPFKLHLALSLCNVSMVTQGTTDNIKMLTADHYIRQPSTELDECYVFTPVCVFVCLLAGLLKTKSYGRIWTKYYGKVASHPRTIPLNFGGDPDCRIPEPKDGFP